MAAMGIAESVCRLSLRMGLTNCPEIFLSLLGRVSVVYKNN